MNDDTRFAPGSFGCHEAVHTAHVLAELVCKRLCEHPVIAASPAWAATAERARDAPNQLYQDFGAKHIGAWARAVRDYGAGRPHGTGRRHAT